MCLFISHAFDTLYEISVVVVLLFVTCVFHVLCGWVLFSARSLDFDNSVCDSEHMIFVFAFIFVF